MIGTKNYFLLIIEIALIIYIKFNTAVPFSTRRAIKDVLTDTQATDISTDDRPFGLKIYFTDVRNNDRRSTERINIDNNEQDVRNDNKLHKFLLTSIDEKQINSRHGLYKNPIMPEIKFRTESPASLKTVASPLLVQNSVKNKLVENTKRRLKNRRGERDRRSAINKAEDKANTVRNTWPKTFSVNEASWFKRYKALYNDMLKRNGKGAATTQKRQPPMDYYHYDSQIATATQRTAMPTTNYYFNYVYPLYHLHSTENKGQFANPNFIWNKPPQNMQLRSRNVVPGTHLLQNFPQVRKFNSRLRNSLPTLINQSQAVSRKQKASSRHLLQEYNKFVEQNNQSLGLKTGVNTWPYNGRRASLVKSPQRPRELKHIANSVVTNGATAVKDSTLQNIGIRDDASFMEASPNYDNSAFTLHTMQSLMPKAQVKSAIPLVKQTPMIIAKDSSTEKSWLGLPRSGEIETKNPPQNIVDMSGRYQMQIGAEKTSSKNLLLTNSAREEKTSKQFAQRSEITRPVLNKITPEQNGITLRFFKEAQKPRVEFPPENEDMKRDIIYKDVNPLSDIDSDDVTAENLAAIFNELDGRIDEVMQDKVAKKDSVARPETNDVSRLQDEIEMTVYDTSAKIPIRKSPRVNFVNVTGNNETNLQQNLEMQDIETDNKIGSIKETIIRPGFDLKRLHFGLRNGNTFD